MSELSIVPLSRWLGSALLALLLSLSSYANEPPRILLSAERASSLIGDRGPVFKAKLGTIKIKPFSGAILDTPQLSHRTDWPQMSRKWLSFFALSEKSFGAGLRTLLTAPKLFDDSAEIVINVEAELLSLKEELDKGFFLDTQHSHATVRYAFKAESLGFAASKDITSHGKFEESGTTQGTEPVEGMEIALTQNLVELVRVLTSEVSAQFNANSEDFAARIGLAKRAESEGDYRKAFRLYSEWSSKHDFNAAIVEAIIKLYHKLDPPPAVPEEARKLVVFAQTATKLAKNDKDYDKAIAQYVNAVRLAPWWADLYINLALLQEATGRFAQATETLKRYLMADPNAPDAQKIRTKIYELESRAKAG